MKNQIFDNEDDFSLLDSLNAVVKTNVVVLLLVWL
jgi:hypothetical protein